MMTPMRWLVVILATVVAVLVGIEMVRKSVIINREQVARKEAEAKLAEAAGALASKEAPQRDLERLTEVLRGEIDSLSFQLGQKPKTVEVVKWKTKEVEIVTQVPGEVVCPPGYQPITLATVPPKQECAPVGGGPSIPPCPDCPPVKLEVHGVEARMQSKAGTLFAVGEITLKQTEPVLHDYVVPFESGELTVATPPPTRVRWMLGVGAQLTDNGMQYGVAALTPQFRIGHLAARGAVTASTDVGSHGSVGGWLLAGWARR